MSRPIWAEPAAALPEQVLAPYLTSQLGAQVETERAINFVCSGQGAPTVILCAGLGHWSWWWWKVQSWICSFGRSSLRQWPSSAR